MGKTSNRRDFLRLAAGAAAVAAGGVACAGNESEPSSAATKKAESARTLRIAQWSHFVPAYDSWFDSEYTPRWGTEHDVGVTVDHFPLTELPTRAAAEVAAAKGHDLFQFTSAPSAFEDEVLDLRDVLAEVEAKLGPTVPLVERSVRNPKTGKVFGFSESWVPNVLHYRTDLWEGISRPDTWDQLFAAGPALKASGNPIGLSFGSANADFDASWAALSLMHSYGASVQDEAGVLTVNRPSTVEAVRLAAELYRNGTPEDVLLWDSSGNNRYLASGRGSLILNAISAVRAVENQDPELAAKIALLPAPQGPSGRYASYVVNVYVIWKFATNPDAAKQFLVDLALTSRDSVLRSELYNLPSFPGSVPDLRELAAADGRGRPPGKYALLADAGSWSNNTGYPGYSNAAVDEVFTQFLVPRMFAAAATGELSPEDAVKRGEAEMQPIFDKWREQGKI
ncbi:MAG: ABC transporter substrate-binding protein [Acidimicrobiia bacterium]